MQNKRGRLRGVAKATARWGPTHHLPASEELHAQQGEHNHEEEEQEQQADDGLHGAHQRHHQVPERGPVSGKTPPQHLKNKFLQT